MIIICCFHKYICCYLLCLKSDTEFWKALYTFAPGSLHSLPTTDLKEKLEEVFEETEMLRMIGE